MDKTCSENCLLKVALLHFDWKKIGHRLLKKKQDITDIDREEDSEQLKRDKVLMKWKEQEGSGATYQKLIDTFKNLRNKDAAEGVQQLAIDGMLDEVCSHDHLLEISSWKVDWKNIIIGSEQDATDEEDSEHKVLMKWKEQEGSGATYQKLIDTLRNTGNRDTAEMVHRLATTGNAKLSIKFDMTNCGCAKPCDFESLIYNRCPTRRREPFMCLDTSSLTQKQKDILLLQLKKDADAIFVQWDTIVDEFSSWMEENVSVEVYKKILLTVPGVTSAVKEVKMLNDRKQKIMDAKCHLDCFAILLDYHSWFNWSILEAVISSANRKTQKDPSEFLSRLKSYVHQLHQYCKRNIFECPALSCMSSTKSKTYLVLKVTEDQLSTVDMVSAEKIQQFTAELMKPFEIEEYVLNLHTVGTGCMEMVYSIPQCIYNELFPLNEDQCYSLATLGVMEIITKDCHYKKDHSTLRLQHFPPYKTIGADEKQGEVHFIQEISPPSTQYEIGVKVKDSAQVENPSTLNTQTIHEDAERLEVAERIDRPPVMSQLFDVFLWRPMLHGIGATRHAIDAFVSRQDQSSSKGFFYQNMYKLLKEDVKLRDSIVHYVCKEANWRALIRHIGLKMDANQLKNFPPEDILLTILKEWNDQKGVVTVRRFCDVCNELGILEVEQYMKHEEEVGPHMKKLKQTEEGGRARREESGGKCEGDGAS